MKEFYASIVAADHVFYEGPCESLIIPTPDGMYGIQAGHISIITAMIPGKLTYRVPGEEDKYAAVSEGIVKITGTAVLVMADSIERPEDIDELRSREAMEDAKEKLLQKHSMQEYRSAQAQLARAINRLNVKKKDSLNL